MSRYSRADVELFIKTLGYEGARQKLRELEKQLGDKLPSRAGMFRKSMGAVSGFIGHHLKANLVTLASAIRRTFAYGLINSFGMAVRKLNADLKQTSDTSLELFRSATIMTKGGKDTSATYDSLATDMLRLDKHSLMLTKDYSELSAVLAKAGLRGEDFKEALEIISQVSAVSGDNARSLALDFIRIATAFNIPKEQFKDLADVLVTGSTNAVVTVKELLDATKYAGANIVGAYGKGIESAKLFVASIAASGQASLRTSQAGRSLRNMMLELLDPSSKTAQIMADYGLKMYQGDKTTQRYSATIDTTYKNLAKLNREMGRLNKQEMAAARRKDEEALTKIREKQSTLQEKINTEQAYANKLFDEFLKSGGKLKKPIELMDEFYKLIKKGDITSTQFQGFINQMFGKRGGMAPSALINQMESWKRLTEVITNSGDNLRMYNQLLSSFGGKAGKATADIDKFKQTLLKAFLEPFKVGIFENISKNILDPLSKQLTADEYWTSIRDSLYQKILVVFEPLSDAIGKFLSMVFMPEKIYGIEAGSAEHKKKLKEMTDNIVSFFGPFAEMLAQTLGQAGKRVGAAFVEGIFDEMSNRLGGSAIGRHLQLRALREKYTQLVSKPSKRFGTGAGSEWDLVQRAYRGDTSGMSKAEAAKWLGYATSMKGMGMAPGSKPYQYERAPQDKTKIDNFAKMISTALAAIPEPAEIQKQKEQAKEEAAQATEKVASAINEATQIFRVLKEGQVVMITNLKNTAENYAQKIGGEVVSSSKEVTGSMSDLGNTIVKGFQTLENKINKVDASLKREIRRSAGTGKNQTAR